MTVSILEFVFHIDQSIHALMQSYGLLIYLLLFIIIFCETGLVFTPFLPGDSIIFTCGALAATGGMNLYILWFSLIIAAILGDGTNYLIGKKVGNALLNRTNGRFIKREYVERAQSFYHQYGGEAIFLGRFIPIIRTFVPFVAGIGKMPYKKFGIFNISGGITWVSLFLTVGYFFGNLPFVKNRFSFIVVAIILLSLLPIGIEFIRNNLKKRIREDS